MRFRKIPAVIEAEQFFRERTPWPKGVEAYKPTICELEAALDRGESGVQIGPNGEVAYVVTIHGQRAYLADGDWVLPEPDGQHFYPCKPDIFEKAYEKVA